MNKDMDVVFGICMVFCIVVGIIMGFILSFENKLDVDFYKDKISEYRGKYYKITEHTKKEFLQQELNKEFENE